MLENNFKIEIVTQMIKMRFIQMIVNEKYKDKEFKIPIHLAFGHEAIAVAIGNVLSQDDKMILSHRNIHYNIARGATLLDLINEYLLKEDGLASGKKGSMNLTNKKRNILYTSSILGNNLGVGAGVALGLKSKNEKKITCIVTGDGAMEEGSFYETLLILSSQKLPSLIVIENNGWSLGTKIEERRCKINTKLLVKSLGGVYCKLNDNNIFNYIEKITELKKIALKKNCIIVVEIVLTTLGDWILKSDESSPGKFINYHAGPAPTINISDWPLIKKNRKDPLFVLEKNFDISELKKIALEVKSSLLEY